ncbi:zinc finger protein [Macleaya cordata]|uniref:Zinc finger protein n=1 Tax=Macleaya cordata TaxID=56857 RepID=A0A200QG62_MACCD|nr:zinc finger protein [Macleaya cordata]
MALMKNSIIVENEGTSQSISILEALEMNHRDKKLEPEDAIGHSECSAKLHVLGMRLYNCIDMEDIISLGREILEAWEVEYDESIRDLPTVDEQESAKEDVDSAETSGREDSNPFLLKLGSEPFIGLQFSSEGEAYEYYKAYAKENGFGIRKSHVERSRVDHSLISRKYVCVKQGFRSLKDKRYEGKVVRHRRVTRVDCRAAMIIKRRSGKWVVHRFHKEHNHDLDLSKASELQSHRNMANSTKSILEALYKTQCINMEDDINLGQKVLEVDVAVSDKSVLEPQSTASLQEDVNETGTSGREANNREESPNGNVNAAETNGKEDTKSSPFKLGSEPFIGLQFGSQDEAYEYYNAYAKEKGFSIRKSRIERSRIDHSMISRLYVCANQGLRSTKDKRYEGKVVRPRQETRLDCRACMFIKKRSGRWVVDRFQDDHNHDLVDPAKADKLRSHRKMTNTTKSMVEALYQCGIGPSKIIDLLTEVAVGAKDILKSNEQEDSENEVKKEKKNNIRVECYRLLEYFHGIQAADPGFFYAVEIGENRSMRSIFWADSQAREAYKKFGDVLVFDTICRTNKYLFPFASFTGVNHHRQPVLFGCGLLADETVESFIWLFETWLRAMSNQQPTSMITNQDKVMKVAVEKVFPETRHRFCMWYIEKDELENLSHVFNMHPDFPAEYKKCIYSSRTPKDFESGWEVLLVKYNLKDNKWLSRLYNHRHHWVPLYLRDTFFGSMTTTHKCEGMISYFDGFLHGGTPINEFLPQYERAVKQRREEEAIEDFLTVCRRAVLTSKNPIEEQAARVYTRNMFATFEHEFVESSGCTARKIAEEETLCKYLVGKYKDKDDRMNIVTFNLTDNSASCSCQMFEFEGMLCRHVLKVFQVVDVFEIPPEYILKRWTMSSKYYVGSWSSDEVGGGSHDPSGSNIWLLKDATKKFVELGETCTERINVAINILQEGIRKLDLISVPTVAIPPENLGSNTIHEGENIDEQSDSIWMMDLNITVPDPPRVKQKGRPVSSRMKLGIEQAQKKKRTCGTCKETGHYTRTCPKGVLDHQAHNSTMLPEPFDQSQSSTIFQGHIDQSQASAMLQEPVDESQTSIMLQGPFGQSQIFAML